VRLIDDQQNQPGVLGLEAAERIATAKGLDLAERASQATPPV